MDIFSIFGFIAMVASAIGFLPQVIKTFRTKRAKDISLNMLILIIIASVSWLTYGLGRSDTYIILTNTIMLVLVSTVIVMKIK